MQNLIINIPFNSTDVFHYVSFKVYLLAASKHRLSLQIFICCVYCSPIVPWSQCWRILCSGRTWAFLQVMTSLIGIPYWCWVFRFGGLQKKQWFESLPCKNTMYIEMILLEMFIIFGLSVVSLKAAMQQEYYIHNKIFIIILSPVCSILLCLFMETSYYSRFVFHNTRHSFNESSQGMTIQLVPLSAQNQIYCVDLILWKNRIRLPLGKF